MKLLRYGPLGQEKPGLLDGDGNIRDLSTRVPDLSGEVLSDAGLARLAALDVGTLPIVEGAPRIGACVAGVGKFMAIGLNFSDHAKETGMAEPKEPVLFTKHTSCLSGPNDDVVLPRGSIKADWEVELGVIIGTRAKYVTQAHALDHVAGFCVVNDVSERAFQLESTGQWVKGKSCDTFGPIGPWLVTRDEISDPQALDLWLDVNGERRQRGNTATMIFSVAHIVSYLSNFFTLYPGDVICTGTPPGVGMGMKPQQFLKPGDEMRLGVQGLGEQRQRVVADA
ncbi:fumarylacetoacetate hydrolase family protein [Magnetovibrio blakemorei]|uniref:2-hydroxyhepta-2,4-diene-1,7-dioate isomerase n=1 Tax=Magnetovibrio blakemorei TaxID=28181 RepID=A0A1E5Q8X4_9PROT|nr:fumarylacetoacetate hydrolase family protein [Magnetovibrio blakemorei]OEJ67914.1 2-hydroxyhepta-2,4-diene-1,7-dioate isomerase [Magnetovibrio blakemorei]